MAKAKLKTKKDIEYVKLSLTMKEAATLNVLLMDVIRSNSNPVVRLNRISDSLIRIDFEDAEDDILDEFPGSELEVVYHADRGIAFLEKQEDDSDFEKVAEGMGYSDTIPVQPYNPTESQSE